MDNGTFAYHDRAEILHCRECGGVVDKTRESLAGVRIQRLRNHDISFTYDGVCVVSDRFREVVEEARLLGASFQPFPDDPGFLALWPTVVVEIDPEASQVKYDPVCSTCGKRKGIYSPFVRLKPGSTVPSRGFARTDLWFAGISGYDERCPIILCGDEAAAVLRAANLKGLEFTGEE